MSSGNTILRTYRKGEKRNTVYNINNKHECFKQMGGFAQWLARLTRNLPVGDSYPIKGSCCFPGQETVSSLSSTG